MLVTPLEMRNHLLVRLTPNLDSDAIFVYLGYTSSSYTQSIKNNIPGYAVLLSTLKPAATLSQF